MVCLHAPPVAPKVDMKPRSEAETFALADLDQFQASRPEGLGAGAFGHEENAATVRVEVAQHALDFGQIGGSRDYELKLIGECGDEPAEHCGLIAKPFVLSGPLSALA